LFQQTSAPKKLFYGPLHRWKVCLPHWQTSDQDYIPAADYPIPLPSDRLPHQPLGAIADDSFAESSADGKAKATVIQAVGYYVQHQQSVGPRLSLAAGPLKISIFPKTILLLHCADCAQIEPSDLDITTLAGQLD